MNRKFESFNFCSVLPFQSGLNLVINMESTFFTYCKNARKDIISTLHESREKNNVLYRHLL